MQDGRGIKNEVFDLCADHLKKVRQFIALNRHTPSRRFTREEIGAVQKRLVEFIVRNPGCHVRDIAAALTLKAERVSYHLRPLVKDKTLKRTGNRMSSKYFPAK